MILGRCTPSLGKFLMRAGGEQKPTYWMSAGSEIPPGWASDGGPDIFNTSEKSI